MKREWMVLSVFLFISIANGQGSFSPAGQTDVAITVDGEAPIVNITSPLNIVYGTVPPILVNYSIIDVSLNSIWYWLNDGINISLNGSHFYLSLAEGSYTLRIYANDSLGRENYSEVEFVVNDTLVSCGDLVCNGGEACSSCPEDCGACPAPPLSEEDEDLGPSSGASAVIDFEFDKEIIEVELKQGESRTEKVKITNIGQIDLNIDLETELIEDFLVVNEWSFPLKKQETKEIELDFVVANDESPDSYVGKIVGKWRRIKREIDILIEIKESIALFDIITELSKDKVKKGDDVNATISIFNLGGVESVEVDLYYSIIDFEDKTIKSKTEKIFIEDKVVVVRSLSTEDLEEGNYVFYSRVSYEDVLASSSQVFKVIDKDFLEENSFALILILIVILLFILLVSKRRKTRETEEEKTVYFGG